MGVLFQVCVANCPGENFLAIEEAVKIGETKTKEKIICKENVTVGSFTVKQLVDQGLCAAYYMQSKPSMPLFLMPRLKFSNPFVHGY